MANNNYEFDDAFLIEGLRKEDLEKLQKSKQKSGWEKVFGAYQNNKVLRAEVTAIETITKNDVAIVMVDGVKRLSQAQLFGIKNKRAMTTYVVKEVALTIENYDGEAEIFTGNGVEARRIIAELKLDRVSECDVTPFVITGIRSFGLFGDIG